MTQEELQIKATFKIHSGKLDEFKKLAAECMESVLEKDSGTLQYDWFFNEDQTECVVREKYANSASLMEHSGNLGPLFGAMMAVADFSAEIYGQPTDELMTAIGGLDLKIYQFFQGM